MFSWNVRFAPRGRNNCRQPRRSVREASDDKCFNGSGRTDFTWENGNISALPCRSCFPTDTFNHRCLRRRGPESLPLPRYRSHKYVNRSGWGARSSRLVLASSDIARPWQEVFSFVEVLHALDCMPFSLEEILSCMNSATQRNT